MGKSVLYVEQESLIRDGQNREALTNEITAVEAKIPALPPPSTTADISNLLDDTDFNYSLDAYTNAGVTPGGAGDPNQRSYNWYRIERATALLVEDDAHCLKGSGHSLFGGETADTPRWNRTNGWAELGQISVAWDMCCPLPNNFVIPSMRFYVQMVARLRTATPLPGSIKFFVSLYDNTVSAPDSLPDVITGSAFTLDGSVFGSTGATTRAYQLIVQTDYGDEIESTVKTITNAPVTLTPTNGIRLSWPRFPGFTNVDIYVTVSGNSFLVGRIGDGASSFLDVGQTLKPVSSVPIVTTTRPRAYAETRIFIPGPDWVEYDFSIIVPQTYDFGKTTGKQWVRLGVLGAMTDAHQLEIDRIGLSTGFGLWSISQNDRNAKSLPSSTQNGSTQGPPSGGGGPPDDGSGNERCSTLETLITVCDVDGANGREIPLRDVEVDDYLVSEDLPNKVTAKRPGWSDTIITIETENGAGRRCSPSDRWLVEDGPKSGTPARDLSCGVSVATYQNNATVYSGIQIYSVSTQGEAVGILSTNGSHLYVAGGAFCHNDKAIV